MFDTVVRSSEGGEERDAVDTYEKYELCSVAAVSRGGNGRPMKTTNGQTVLSGVSTSSVHPPAAYITVTNHSHPQYVHRTSSQTQPHSTSHITTSQLTVTMVLPPRLRRIDHARFLAEAILLISLLSASLSSLAVSAFGFHCENAFRSRQQILEWEIHHPSSRRGTHHHRKTLQRYCSPYPDDDDVLLLEKEEYADDDIEILVGPINGTTEGYVVTQQYHVPIEGFPGADGEIDSMSLTSIFSSEDMSRLQLKANNVTLAVALMLLDPDKYPTQSRARKAIR